MEATVLLGSIRSLYRPVDWDSECFNQLLLGLSPSAIPEGASDPELNSNGAVRLRDVGILLGMIEKRRWLYFIGGAMFFLGLIIGKHHGGSVVALVGFLVMAGSVPLGIWSARRKRQLSLERESRKSE